MRYLILLLGCWLLLGCQTADSLDVESADSAPSFSYIGTANLPAGFDAQGHRGARGLLPENTLPAFEAALDLGVTTLELDLHFTQDGEVVVWHDPLIEKEKCRLPAGSDAPDPKNPLRRIFISQQPLAVVQAYQCDQNPDSDRFPEQSAIALPLAGADYHIVTLSELFDFVATYATAEGKSAEQRTNASTINFNIETKRNVEHPEYINDDFTGGTAGAFELTIRDIVREYGLSERIVIQSFDHRSLRVIRAIDPDIRLAALTTNGEAKIKVYNGYKFDIWSPNYNDVTQERIAEAHTVGLLVVPWTVNDSADMSRLIEWGVDGLISDRPDLLLNNQ
jgi:glycerophosphoryl diester phosphodiesterase